MFYASPPEMQVVAGVSELDSLAPAVTPSCFAVQREAPPARVRPVCTVMAARLRQLPGRCEARRAPSSGRRGCALLAETERGEGRILPHILQWRLPAPSCRRRHGKAMLRRLIPYLALTAFVLSLQAGAPSLCLGSSPSPGARHAHGTTFSESGFHAAACPVKPPALDRALVPDPEDAPDEPPAAPFVRTPAVRVFSASSREGFVPSGFPVYRPLFQLLCVLRN